MLLVATRAPEAIQDGVASHSVALNEDVPSHCNEIQQSVRGGLAKGASPGIESFAWIGRRGPRPMLAAPSA